MDDIVPSLKSKLPQLRGRLLANEPLAPLTWFRVGGPAQALFMPEDENDLAYAAGQPAARDSRHGDRPRLEPDRARRRRRRRRDPARARLQRNEGRSGPSRARRNRGAGSARRQGRAGGRHRGARVPARHSGRDRRRAAHERRRLWARDQGRSDRSARRRSRRQRPCLFERRHAFHLPALRRARRRDLHRGAVSRHARRSAPRSPPRWTRSPASARPPSR